jgi:anthranilate synthase/indole-3-glycerol phosphate synthase/phosphoribosylanthranilate isomerase
MTTLLIDNYDSFTFNVYQSLANLGADVKVYRNDEISLEEAIAINPRNLVISPGPGHPSGAGISNDCIRYFAGKIPILGVCLGQQCIYEIYGGIVSACGEMIHGKTTPVKHDANGLFKDINQDIECTRYHSLSGDPKTLPLDLEVTAWTDNGIIMAVRHRKFIMEGVQFHPESVASESGEKMFENFLQWEGGCWDSIKYHPEWIIKYDLVEEKEDLSHGIPLSMASKMNSTVKQVFGKSSSSKQKNETILQKIVAKRKIDVMEDKSSTGKTMSYLEKSYRMGLAPSLVNFKQRLLNSFINNGVAVLAEIKRASPSKGDIDISVHSPHQALLYAEGGAAAISILTEPNWFKGSLDDLKNVRAVLNKMPNRPALLRKEFIFDIYQILEARLAGADTILLIVAILSNEQLKLLMGYARTMGMEPLVEVASTEEMKRALAVGASIIGVNNRDLNTFSVDMNRTSELSELTTGKDVILLALSGIVSRSDVERYVKSGAKGVLVGESLMKSVSKPDKVKELLGINVSNSDLDITDGSFRKKVKICGLTNLEDAIVSIENGADALGFIFAKDSPRYINPASCSQISKHIRAKYPSSKSVLRHYSTNSKPTSPKEWFGSKALPSRKPLLVGVFTDSTVHEINEIAEMCDLDLIQCHKKMEPYFHKLLNRPSIQVLGMTSSTNYESLIPDIEKYTNVCDFLLLDTVTQGAIGGTGQEFDWKIIDEFNNNGIPVWMAGGITPINVSEAFKFNPMVIDVCSGVESKKGKKDHSKLKQLINPQ